MREIVSRLNSSYLQNERSIWICEPESVSGASDLVVFLDGERYRGCVDALAVIEALRGQLANSWFVFVSEESPEARWRECPCYPPVGMQEIHENVRHPPHTRHAESVPYTIKTPGTYTLDGNLTYSGTSEAITVSASVVIDLKGFTLSGTGPFNGQIAIYCQNADNVTVQNGRVELFADGVDFQAGAQEVVQNLILLNNELSVIMQGCSYCTIQNCLIVGTGTGSSPVCEGVYLTTDLGVVVKNCQISNAFDGCASGATNGNIFIANQLSNCDYGLFLDTTDKYQGNVEINAGFAGGIAVGYENN